MTKEAQRIRDLRQRIACLERQLGEVQARLSQEIRRFGLLDAKFAGYVAAVQQLAPCVVWQSGGGTDAPAT